MSRLDQLLCALVLAAFAAGCASSGSNSPPVSPATTNAPDPTQAVAGTAVPPLPPQGPTASDRVASAVDGLVLGAMVGSIAGPIGAAVGATGLALYGAISGRPVMSGGSGGGYGSAGGYGSGGGGGYGGGGGGYGAPGYPTASAPGSRAEAQREAALENALEQQVAKGNSLEDQIEAELQRQEELLREIDREDQTTEALVEEAAAPGLDGATLAERADPRIAPRVPAERDLPAAIFEEEHRRVPKGEWGNERVIDVVKRELDADRDGNPEMIRYIDPTSGVILRKEEDKDYDGIIDTWTEYESGIASEIRRDNDGDGQPDEWETYGSDGRMTAREVDRDYDGQRDAFYQFQSGSLATERHDGNSDGTVDRSVFYEERRLARTEEDLDRNGAIDTWTMFGVANAGDTTQEVITRIEKDTSGDGRADTFETYELHEGRPTITRREEDKNGDGEIDIVSIYQGGKLKERQIHDPDLVPL